MGRVPILDPRLPYYRKGKFSLLGPSKAEHLTFGVGRGPRATLTGQRAMRGPKAEGLPTLAGPSEVVSAARYSLTHEAGFKVINDMIDDLGLDAILAQECERLAALGAAGIVINFHYWPASWEGRYSRKVKSAAPAARKKNVATSSTSMAMKGASLGQEPNTVYTSSFCASSVCSWRRMES